ncbi:PAS domain-containing protein [Haloarcula sp. S1AR25-5A]|uniref:PAS domain-containing protein n=1 Tax=Haloarcula terrestris TaxID=2950533 RepID=A0AAE4F1S4_9EURY|nr:PAS domain-containing protein [Haloarcula terrestris]MDS0223003.1 PAS domain-containing protein [Haloarcula terrestris]
MVPPLRESGHGESLKQEAFLSGSNSDVTVLHIEDDPAFADLVAEFLDRERSYFTILTETDPYDALERLQEEPISCVVSDYEMPGLDGLALLERVREDHPQLPFILFTGRGSEEIASDAISAGVTEYLQKDGGTEQYEVLANRIEQAVARYRAEKHVERGFQAIETAHDGISMLNETGEFIYLNASYANILGYEQDDLIGEHFESIYPSTGVENVYEEMIPQAKADEWAGTTVYQRKDGTSVSVEHSLSFTSDGTMVCTIAERETEIRDTLSLRERAMDAAPIGIVITDPHLADNPIIYANDRFVELTGYQRDEIVGRNCRFLQGPDTRREPVAKMRRAIASEESVTVELRNYRKDGAVFWNRVTIAPLFDAQGDLDHFVGFQEDVTNRR